MQRLRLHSADEKPKTVLLQYVGGKARLASWIISHFPKHKIYVEPFGGAASVLLHKPRAKLEVYNDIEDEVVNLMQVMRDDKDFKRLLDQLGKTPYSRVEYLNAHEPATEPVERARSFIVRVQMAWGGRMPADRIETFDPTNSMSWMPFIEGLQHIHARLQGVTIEHRDAVECMLWHDSPSTLHYVDPPYLAADQNRYKHGLSVAQHKALLACLTGLAGMVVVSGYPNHLYARVLAGWRYVTRKTTAALNNVVVTEALWINKQAADKLDFWTRTK